MTWHFFLSEQLPTFQTQSVNSCRKDRCVLHDIVIEVFIFATISASLLLYTFVYNQAQLLFKNSLTHSPILLQNISPPIYHTPLHAKLAGVDLGLRRIAVGG